MKLDRTIADLDKKIQQIKSTLPERFRGITPVSLGEKTYWETFTQVLTDGLNYVITGQAFRDVSGVIAGVADQVVPFAAPEFFARLLGVDTSSAAYLVGTILGIGAQIGISIVAGLATGCTGFVLTAVKIYNLANTLWGIGKALYNIYNTGQVGWLDALNLLPAITYGLSALGKVAGVFKGFCFAPGTQVITGIDGATGAYLTQAIDTLTEGDTVLTKADADDPASPLVEQTVTRVYRRTTDHLRIVQVGDEQGHVEVLKSTDEHPFYVEGRGWIPAGELQAGDALLLPDGRTARVILTEVEAHPEGLVVYNLEVNGAHSYFVADGQGTETPVWVHNACKVFDIIPYKQQALGFEKHHGVLNQWAQANLLSKYAKTDAPAMVLTTAQHNATRAVFAKWRYDKTGSVTGAINWKNVKPREVQELSQRMFNAAGVGASDQAKYFSAFNRYLYTGKF